MSIAIQKGFWQDTYLATTRQKLAELYHENPEIAQSEKRVILEFWKTYEGLPQILGDKLNPFVSWFLGATSPETITRCFRALKEDGTVKLNHEDREKRQEREQEWRQYWGNEKKLREEQ